MDYPEVFVPVWVPAPLRISCISRGSLAYPKPNATINDSSSSFHLEKIDRVLDSIQIGVFCWLRCFEAAEPSVSRRSTNSPLLIESFRGPLCQIY